MSLTELAENEKAGGCIAGCELVVLASAISVALANMLDADDIDTLASLFSMVGSNLSAISASCE